MDVNEALRIAAMHFRTQSRGAGRDTDTLLELANDVDLAREQLRIAKSDLEFASGQVQRLTLRLNSETESRRMEKDRADKAEASNCNYLAAINGSDRRLAESRNLIRKLRKEVRAAKGGG